MGICNKIALFLISSVFVLLSCHKKETLQVDNESQSVVDNAIADQEFMWIVPTVQQHAANTKGTGAQGKSFATSCDTLQTLSGDTLWGMSGHIKDPIYQLNISNSACSLTSADNKLRTGLVTVKLTNRLKNPGATMIIKLLNYKADNLEYYCDSMIVTTVASNTLFTTYNIKIINGAVKSGSSWTIKYSLDRTITNYYNGNPLGTNAYVSIYGSSSGTNRHGKLYTTNVSSGTPLIKHKNCRYIDTGLLELTPQGFKPRIVDYGRGECDEEATFLVNNNTIAFKLK